MIFMIRNDGEAVPENITRFVILLCTYSNPSCVVCVLVSPRQNITEDVLVNEAYWVSVTREVFPPSHRDKRYVEQFSHFVPCNS